jgi:hypothetical protein
MSYLDTNLAIYVINGRANPAASRDGHGRRNRGEKAA